MTWIEYAIAALLLVTMYLNVVASIGLSKADDLNRFQKIAQGIIVWMFPLFGAWLILSLLRVNNPKSIPYRMLGYRNPGWFEMAEGSHATWIDSSADHIHSAEHFGHHSGSGDIGGGHGS